MASVADLIVRRLMDAGVAALFGMPGGGGNLDLIDAAGRAGLPFVLTSTETGAALAAVAQAEITGRPGACLTTLGPGVTSVMNGIACAHLDRAPLIVFTDRYSKSAGAVAHQRLDHRALMTSITKWSTTLTADNADDVMTKAIASATAGQPGAVHIDVADSLQKASQQSVSQQSVSQQSTVSQLPRDQFANRLTTDDWRLMTTASKPLLVVGLGARRAVDAAAIRAFCAKHGVPAMVTYKAKGVVPDRDPHFAGIFTNSTIEQSIVSQADLLIGVGLDPVELLPRPWKYTRPIVSIGGSCFEDGHVPFAAQLVTDVPSGLQEIGDRLTRTEWDLVAVRHAVAAQRDLMPGGETRLTADGVVRVVSGMMSDARVTVDAGAHMIAATMLWPVTEPNGMLISNGLSTMGFALPAAIGASLLDRSRRVVALTGDGGLLICAGELLTAVRERARVMTVVFSDASLSLIAVKQQQRALPAAGVSIGDVAWCALAESLGVAAQCARTEAELTHAVARSLEHDGPTLIEARVDPSAYAETLRVVRG